MATVQYCNYDIKGTLAVAGNATFANPVTIEDSAASNPLLNIYNTSAGSGATIRFSDQTAQVQTGDITFFHVDGASQGGGASWHFVSEPDTVLVVGSSTIAGRFVAKSAGNVAEVDYGFYDDVNTGMFRADADTVRLAGGGVYNLSVSATNAALYYQQNLRFSTTAAGASVAGGLVIAGANDALLDLNQTGTDTGWSYINFKTLGTRNYYVGQDSGKNFNIFNDNIDVIAISVSYASNLTTIGGDLTVSGGDITLSGTGRIQGVDTVSASTDAANKAYVDSAVSGISSGVTSIATTNGITGGTITSTGTIQVDSTVVRTTGAQSIAGTKTFTTRINVDTSAGNEAMGLFTENNTAAIADTFSGNTSKSYIYFTPVAGSNDPGFIMHESSATETNEGVLHLVPSDDNATNDYVSIHGTNDPDAIRLHTSGLIETGSNYQLQIKSGSGSIYLNDGVSIEGDLSVSGGDITLGGTGRIQGVDTVSASTDAANKAYVDAHVSPAGTYLPLVGGTMSGNIVMGDNDITGIDQLTFSSGTFLTDVSSNYLELRYASTTAGGIIVLDGDGTTQGYLYADGGNFSSFGLLHGSGSWAVRCKELAEVELRYNNSAKLTTLTDGVTISGKLGIGTSFPGTEGYSFAEDLVIKGGASADDGVGITLAGNGKRYGVIAFGDTADANAGEIFYDHNVNAMYFRTNGSPTVTINSVGKVFAAAATSSGDSSLTLTTKGYVDAQISSIPSGLNFQGNWNASTNSPTLASGTGTPGFYYNVSVAGSTNLDGETDWQVGDWAVFVENGTNDFWEKIDNTSALTGVGVAGRVTFWDGTNTLSSDGDLTFDGSNLTIGGNLTVGGSVTWSGGSSAESNSAYDNMITAFSDSGSSTITLTLTQQDGGTLTTSFSNPQGTVTGVGSANRIAYWANGTMLQSNAGFTFDGTSFATPGGITTGASSSFAGNISVADDIIIQNAGGVVSFTGSGYIGAADNFYVGGASNGTDHTYIGDNGRNVTIYNGATLTISGALNLQTLSNATTDTNAFLVSDSGEVKYRTGSQLLSDIGGAPATGGSYLPLTAGSTKPLTGDLYLAKSSNQGQLFFGTANANYEIFGGGTFGYMGYNTDGYHRFLIQGSEKMRIHSNSNVGIGATLPNAKLEVTGDLNDNWAGRFENTNSGGFGILAKIAGTSANEKIFEARVGSSAKMLVTGDGNATFANDIIITNDILPVNTGASDLGSSSKRFGSLFVNGISTGTITPTTIELQGSIKLLNKAQTAYIDFATRNTSGSETVMDITNAGSATFSGNISAGNGTFTGDVTADQILTTSNGLGVNVRIGDDVFLGDINVANTMRISGNQDSSKGFITFGNNNTSLGRSGTGALTWGGNFVVSGGDITLGGTGRIQGIDTVN